MSAAFASTCALVGGGLIYARVVADTVGPGATRLLLLAPALCVNVAAPLLVLDPEAEPLWTAIAVANFAWWRHRREARFARVAVFFFVRSAYGSHLAFQLFLFLLLRAGHACVFFM
jgi:hypothetical protein